MAHPPQRRHVHTRSIRVDAYVRDDGLWDVEAQLVDTKSRDLQLASGVRAAGDPVHDVTLTITIDTDLNVRDARASTASVPYPGFCNAIEPAYAKLIGLNLLHQFRRHVRERLGGMRGCTHLTELADVLPTAAIQAFAGERVRKPQPAADGTERQPFYLDSCHALVTTGPAVAQFYPRWYRGAATGSTGASSDAAPGAPRGADPSASSKTQHGEPR